MFLAELLDLAEKEGLAEPLLQLVVSNLLVSAEDLARMMAMEAPGEDVAWEERKMRLSAFMAGESRDAVVLDETGEEQATRWLRRLVDMGQASRERNGQAWLHRWTAEGIGAAACMASLQRGRGMAAAVAWGTR